MGKARRGDQHTEEKDCRDAARRDSVGRVRSGERLGVIETQLKEEGRYPSWTSVGLLSEGHVKQSWQGGGRAHGPEDMEVGLPLPLCRAGGTT